MSEPRPAPSGEPFTAEFERLRSARVPSTPRLERLREESFRRFASIGIPTTRDEEWKYTNLSSIAAAPFERPAPRSSAALSKAEKRAAEAALAAAGPVRLVFLDGRFDAALSSVDGLPGGVRLASLGALLRETPDVVERHLDRRGRAAGVVEEEREEDAFPALNSAFLEDGAFVEVPPGVVLEEPVSIVFLSAAGGPLPAMSHPRVLALFGEGSQGRVHEIHASLGDGAAFTNSRTDVRAGDGAVVEHALLQTASPEALHVGVLHARAGRSASFASHAFTFGGAIARNEVRVLLAEDGAECLLNGLWHADGRRRVDTRTIVDHAKPHGSSRQLYKGILDGSAAGIFNGLILVREDAQKTDAKQVNRNLLLSHDALVNTKPQLEIRANDVKCTHGATIGQIEEEPLFYLRSRGIGADEARRLLTRAFATELVDRLRPGPLRRSVEAILDRRLGGPGAGAAGVATCPA